MQADTQAAESGAARATIIGLSIFVVVAVAVVVRLIPKSDATTHSLVLPTINALLNSIAAASLVVGYRFIRRKNVRAHRASMLTAFGASSLFLVTYLVHHARVGSVPFHGQGAIRAVYFAFLVPHVILAAVIVPLALLTLYRGYTNRIVQHRGIARYTLPIWLYVSVSGVIVYFMLYHLPV